MLRETADDVRAVSERISLCHDGNNSERNRIPRGTRINGKVVVGGRVMACLYSSVENRLLGAIGGLISEILRSFDPNLSRHSARLQPCTAASSYRGHLEFCQVLQSLKHNVLVFVNYGNNELVGTSFSPKCPRQLFFLLVGRSSLATLPVLSRDLFFDDDSVYLL